MKRVKTVYDHIRSNNIKTAILVALFPIIFVVLVFLFTWIVVPVDKAVDTAIGVAVPTFVICLIWMLISWAFGDSMILHMANAHQIDDSDSENKYIYRLVENVALAAGLPTPRVYIIEETGMNAFATGRTPNDATVALTRGIINRLDKLELEGVIAHEMSHIGNRDIRLEMFVITGLGVTVFISDMILHSITHTSHSRDEKDNSAAVLFMVWLAFFVFNLIISPLLHMAISRKREFAADATGAQITRNPKALASALRKISENPHVASLSDRKSMAAICIANPLAKKALISELMATHPPVEERIKRLESM